MAKSSSEPVANCEICQHFRPQVSFVDAWKRFDDSGPRKEMMQSLKEVRQAETETLENEVELVFELVRAETLEWPDTPRFAPYCGFDGKVLVAALRNRGGCCGDFELACNREKRGCHTCMFAEQPVRHIADRNASIPEGSRPEVMDHIVKTNKEMADADATAMGLEIEQSFFGDGRLPVVRFLPTCGARRTAGRSHVVPFCNLRNDCPDHSPWLPVPPALLPSGPEHVEPHALELTIDLIQQVSRAGMSNPGAFLAGLPSWIAADPRRSACAEWARRGLTRWAGMAGLDAAALSRVAAQPSPERLFPFIAGADAFEWGWLAEQSRPHCIAAANAIVQQVAEFLAGTVRPLEAVRCIESVERLLGTGVFGPEVVTLVDPFRRRLRVVREDMLHAKHVDLDAYYEASSAALLHSVARWLRGKPGADHGMASILGEGFVTSARDQTLRKSAEARRQGTILLARLSVLEDPNAQPYPAQFLEQLTKLNEEAVATDVQDTKDLFRDAWRRLAPLAGLPPSLDVGPQPQAQLASLLGINAPSSMDPIDQAVEQTFELVRRSELPRRRLAAWLIFRRGTLAVTPSAIEFKTGAMPAMNTPMSIEQALLEPASKNLEGFFPPPGIDPVLAACRRVGAPAMVGAAP